MSVLRVYDPAECDEQGYPLDWERCRACDGGGLSASEYAHALPVKGVDQVCSTCDGHGSLKAAVLARLLGEVTECCGAKRGHLDAWTEGSTGPCCEKCRRYQPTMIAPEARCEDCGHPMSEGTWDNDPHWTEQDGPLSAGAPDYFWRNVASQDFIYTGFVHFSPCDAGCRHGGPARLDDMDRGIDLLAAGDPDLAHGVADLLQGFGTRSVEASWRPVDVRTLGWPHDLRPERLAVLCLRCFAARGSAHYFGGATAHYGSTR